MNDLFGDILTEDMGNIFASVYDGDDATLRAIVENPEVYEFVRSATLPNGLLCLLNEGKITREWLEAYATELLETKLEREPNAVWDGWTCLCADLGFASTVPLIERAMQDDLCDPWFYRPEKLLHRARNGGDDRWKHRVGLIADTIQKTSGWPAWQKPVKPKPLPPPPKVVAARTIPKVGRNDPCPCGSGKKHKKCCGD